MSEEDGADVELRVRLVLANGDDLRES